MAFGTTAKVRAPLQTRSRETFDRILDEANKLLDGRDFEDIPLTEICEAAGVSQSSFYARFADKQSLLLCLHERHLERRLALARTVSERSDWRQLPLTQIARVWLRIYLQDRLANAGFLRSMMLAQLRDPSISRRGSEVDTIVSRMIEDYVCECIGEDTEERRSRIRFATHAAVATLVDAVTPPRSFATQLGLSEEEVIDRTAAIWLAAIGADEVAGAATGAADEAPRGH